MLTLLSRIASFLMSGSPFQAMDVPVPLCKPRFKVGETIYFMESDEIKSAPVERVEIVWAEKFLTIKYGRYTRGGYSYVNETDAFESPADVAAALFLKSQKALK